MRLLLLLTLFLIGTNALADDVLSAGQPDEAKLAEYAEQGYRTVIDLRTEGEDRGLEDEAKSVADAGMDYVSMPIGRGGITYENARKLDGLLQEADGPVVVHCGSGNRVGALMALRASFKGASDEEAVAEGEKYGMTRLKGIVEKVLAEKESN